ncbi:GNAT family N-acetyltransferase [Oceanobacillus luteolus]|uniref:GNAT family N-acetyltransferase n=1 Tax=Oceanobacillus luteolus TaxID=1274358 RepID=A0ABW4HU23_9BACI|nr:GNAT family N-acetyltransferase [Oceanobacillus luteolus]MCM3738818.1 GNAT family N-acetyltransferase [Oceanobacillus luteolus]
MLIRYKKNMEKIAMGLLSFMPDDKKDVKKLQQYIKEYETNPDWHLYLWRNDEDILGAIGLRIEDGIHAVIQDLSVNPSHRNLGIGKKLVQEIKRLYSEKYIVYPSEQIRQFYEKCNAEN